MAFETTTTKARNCTQSAQFCQSGPHYSHDLVFSNVQGKPPQ